MTDDVVCEREFNTVIEGEVVPIIVQWMKPRRDQATWRCDYAIAWPDRPMRRRYAVGVDSAQALILALYHVSTELETASSPVRWFDNAEDLGLPAFRETGASQRDPG